VDSGWVVVKHLKRKTLVAEAIPWSPAICPALLGALLACGKAAGPTMAPQPAQATSEAARLAQLNELWSYAPKDTEVGLVVARPEETPT
jgi:hypothetical protein